MTSRGPQRCCEAVRSANGYPSDSLASCMLCCFGVINDDITCQQLCTRRRLFIFINIVRTVTEACSRSGLRSTSSIWLSLSDGRYSASVPFHTLGPQRGTLCPQMPSNIRAVGDMNKKAQLSLTNPRDAKACQNCSDSTCLQRCR